MSMLSMLQYYAAMGIGYRTWNELWSKPNV